MEKGNGGVEGMIGQGLGNVVLSWTLEDILDDHLFANKVNLIPRSFHSLKDYLESYSPPLLEETRSEMSSCLEDISNAPSYKIRSVKAVQHYELYHVDVDCCSNQSCGGSDEYKPRNGDIYILSSIKPMTVNDLKRYGVTFCMVLVSEVVTADAFHWGFKVKAPKNIDTGKEFTDYNNAIFLTNIMTNMRVWKALQFNKEMNNNFKVVNEVLRPGCLTDVTCNICSLEGEALISKLPVEILSIGLNEPQIQAVKAAVSTVTCMHSHFVKLIWGPPGTGKTKTVCAILWAFLHMKYRILTCAPTNIAVVGVCSRLISLLKKSQDTNALIDSPFSLGDIVLFGNKDRMKVNEELQDVFIEHRIDQLVDCFSPIFGWKYRISAMITFFEDCALQYESYLETRNDGDGNVLFLDFLREQFNVVASQLDNCLTHLCIHLPRNCLSKTDKNSILHVINLLGTLRCLIFKDDASDVEMQESFLHDSKITESFDQDDLQTCKHRLSARTQLKEVKSECHKLLKVLKDSLKLPYGVNANWIKFFCLRNASIIFCTASGSFLLHYVEMGPLDVLIVDEAAQLKEAETLIPLRLNGIKHAILVGDEFQLQSVVKSQVSKTAGFGLSLFERLVSTDHPKQLLSIQYRMHPSISLFPNVTFYGNQIIDGPNVQGFKYGKHCSELLFGSYAFINIADGREELDDVGGSRKNMVEVAVVLHLIKSIFKSWKTNGGRFTIGVIASYNSQVKEIKDKLVSMYDIGNGFEVRINSIDGFQGEEDDIIILSTVRCNRKGSIGFLGDIQRMNVALTRSRHCLWILGNAETLLWSGTRWEELVRDAKDRKCFFNATDEEGLAKLILHVKCELNQLDDMFNPNSVLNTAMWKVLFSSQFRKSFARLKSLQTKKEIIQIMLRLANGCRSKRNTMALSDSFQLAKIYKVREQYLVWTVDIVKEERYIQIIKVWDIVPMSQLTKLIARLDHMLSMYTDSYIIRCKAKHIDRNIEFPVSWNTSQDILQYKNLSVQKQSENAEHCQMDDDGILENSKVSESLLLMKFYALTSGTANHLLTANDGSELSVPFELTDEEKDVVRFSSSSFILGRSGTGKTTILTTKLVQKQQQHSLALKGVCVSDICLSTSTFRNDSVDNDVMFDKKNLLKQVFITVSPKLCLAIQDHITRLTSFASTGYLFGPPTSIEMHDTSDHLAQFVDIPDTFHNLPNKHYPLVITFGKFLLMLDGSMSRSFFSKLCNDTVFSSNGTGVSKPLALQMFYQKEVDYEKFVRSYWPHFSSQLTKNLDASIVYTEIISHIKGNLESGSFHDGKLGRSDYIMLAKKRISFFDEEIRENIYDIYLDYEKKKNHNGEFDISDFVIDLHQRLKCDAYMGDKFDFVYVDEVQDLTMRQISLLKYVCTNYEQGFLFAGDTAQTIARGVDFRFEDIRCLFYKEFISCLRIENHEFIEGRGRIKDNFQLSQNFRTHSGVLKLAKSIMDLLYTFFPSNIDRIIPETSLIYGESPVLLESSNDENAIITIFGNTTGECSNMIEFGAEQVILVRDECTKKQLVDIVGNKALVLTIIECKGLEFQDVLLYNFFGGSPLRHKWRVVYEYMNKMGIDDKSGIVSCPNFYHGRHNLLCSELKQLYVAITRTRQRLWIGEYSNDYCKPIFDYWKRLCLVQVRHLDSSFAQAMRAVSTADEWRFRGIKLFNDENFEMATMCFERAGDIFREKWARAAGLVFTADRVFSSKPEMAEALLKKAADMYESIGRPECAAKCYVKLKDFITAGKLYCDKCGESSLEVAGDCFSLAEDWSLAADVYAKAKCFAKCLSMCIRGELFDAGLLFINQWKEYSDINKLEKNELHKIEKSFLETCVVHYVNLRDITHMVELAKVLKSMDLIRKQLKSMNYLDELLELEMLLGNHLEAANLAHLKGNILLEADMLQKVGYFEKSVGLILLHVIVKSLWAPGSKGWPLTNFADKDVFLGKAIEIAKQVSESFYNLVSSEVYVISDLSKDLFSLSKHLVVAHKFKNLRLEIFTLREIIDIHLRIEPCKYVWEPGLVSDVDIHANLIMSQNICSVESLMHIWKLWKHKILKVLSHLSLSATCKENEFELYEQFCLEYFGLLMNSETNTFVLLNPEADWIKTPHILGNFSMMASKIYKASAQHHWRLELLSLGVAILEKLESLIRYSNCFGKTCSRREATCDTFERKALYPFSKGRIVLAIYEVVKFLRDSDTTLLESRDKIKRIFTSSCKYFFRILFPVKWKEGSHMSMLDFHRSMNAKEIIGESVDRDLIPFKGQLTLGQVSRVVMLLFLTGEDMLFDKIIPLLGCMQPWNDLIIVLRKFLSCTSQSISLILKLEHSLQTAFSTEWRGKCDFMSPHCFIYLVDCLLFCASSCLGSGVPFYSTKTAVFEMLRCYGLKGYMKNFVMAIYDSVAFSSVQRCLSSIIEMIKALLIRKKELKEWVLQSSMCQIEYCHLITKMVITLCLANLNSGRTFYLKKFLMHNYILEDLHERFRNAITTCLEVHNNLSDFSNALWMAQDSLIYVTPRVYEFDFTEVNVIVLRPEELISSNLTAKLFPKISRNESKMQFEQELLDSTSSGKLHSMCKIEAFDYSRSPIQTELLEQHEQLEIAIRVEDGDFPKTCLQMCNDLNARLRMCDEIMLDDIVHCLNTVIAWLSQDAPKKNTAPDILVPRKLMMDIKFHSSLIDGGVEPTCRTVEELEQRCPGCILNLINFFESLLKEMNYSPDSVFKVNEDKCKETIDITNHNFVQEADSALPESPLEVDDDCGNEAGDITDNGFVKESETAGPESAPEGDEDDFNETSDITDENNFVKENVKTSGPPPCHQKQNKGNQFNRNGKKSKQKKKKEKKSKKKK